MISADKENGVALIAVLLVTAFLTVISSSVVYQSRSGLLITKNKVEQLKVKQAAESAILLRLADIVNAPTENILSNSSKFKNDLFRDINIELYLADESGKVDLNIAPPTLLQSLLVELGLDTNRSVSVANVILDWRDEDRITREGGAEDAEYASLGYAYGSKDREFKRIEELNLVYGITPNLYEALKPHITVYAQDYGVNLDVASNTVRRAISNASAFNQNIEEDDEDYFDVEEFNSLTGGYIYTITAKAKNKDGITQSLSAIVRINRGNVYEPFTVFNWY